MKINIDHELSELAADITSANGYLECERVIINQIRKHLINGFPEDNIAEYLNAFLKYLNKKITDTEQTGNCINYRYARGFVNSLITTPYWRSWIQSVNI